VLTDAVPARSPGTGRGPCGRWDRKNRRARKTTALTLELLLRLMFAKKVEIPDDEERDRAQKATTGLSLGRDRLNTLIGSDELNQQNAEKKRTQYRASQYLIRALGKDQGERFKIEKAKGVEAFLAILLSENPFNCDAR